MPAACRLSAAVSPANAGADHCHVHDCSPEIERVLRGVHMEIVNASAPARLLGFGAVGSGLFERDLSATDDLGPLLRLRAEGSQ